MSIFSACFGLPTTVQLPATTWSGQIWISRWILPHFDVDKNHFYSLKTKEVIKYFWQKIFFLLHPVDCCTCTVLAVCIVSGICAAAAVITQSPARIPTPILSPSPAVSGGRLAQHKSCKRSISFHNQGEGLYYGLLLDESTYLRFHI